MPLPRLLLLTLLTLMAFAANSVLCRLALFEERMDPALFTLLRLTSGALVLVLLCGARKKSPRQGDWGGALALVIYGSACCSPWRVWWSCCCPASARRIRWGQP